MTRLTKIEIAAHKAWLARWREPTDTEQYVEDVNDYMGSKDFFNQAGVEFLRDAWAAAKFANKRRAKEVRLVAEKWPDFELRLNGQVEQFECVEADVPDRRRGDEYRKMEDLAGPDGFLVEDDPVEDWIARAKKVPEALRAAVEKKVGKRYAGKARLLIYLNINEFGVCQQEIESSFQYVTERARDNFEATWILWKEKIYRPWL